METVSETVCKAAVAAEQAGQMQVEELVEGVMDALQSKGKKEAVNNDDPVRLFCQQLITGNDPVVKFSRGQIIERKPLIQYIARNSGFIAGNGAATPSP